MSDEIYHYDHNLCDVFQLPVLRDNYIYLIANRTTKAALVIDPAAASVVIAACDRLGLTPVAILNTHHHWDHTDGNGELAQHYGLSVIAPGNQTPHTSRAPDPQMQLLDMEVRTLSLPGHTLDHVAYLIDDALFCGDTLFGAGCGRIFEGSSEQMWNSLQTLAQLPAATALYCAHEYTLANLQFARKVDPDNADLQQRWLHDKQTRKQGCPTIPSTIGNECATNPFLRPRNIEFRTRYAEQHGIANQPHAVFAHLRACKDQNG